MTAFSFYNNSEHAPVKAGKRKWEDEADKSSSVTSDHDQLVPHLSPEKRRRTTKFPFSNLMRDMASKYQQPAVTQPVYNPLVMSLLSPMTNPYSRLMAAMANMSSQPSIATPQARAPSPPPASPLDLSNSSDNEIDVTTTDEEAEEQALSSWSVRQVSTFISSIGGCEDLAPMFESEMITGARLAGLTVPQLVQGLGLPVSAALRIVSMVKSKL